MSDAFAPPLDATPSPGSAPSYLPLARRGTVLVGSLFVNIVVSLLVGLLVVGFKAVEPGTEIGELTAMADLPILSAAFGSYVICVVAFFMFGFRANKNLRVWTDPSGLEYTPGSSVVWWFIPIANLWKPYEVFREIWILSDPDDLHEGASGRSVVKYWWMAWLIGSVYTGISTQFPEPKLGATVSVNLIGLVVLPVASLLAIRVVRGIMRRQAATAEARGASTDGM